ncbi:MAG: hypothetical protein DRQ62_10480, partial [Gammaproteobacteria bacterium]
YAAEIVRDGRDRITIANQGIDFLDEGNIILMNEATGNIPNFFLLLNIGARKPDFVEYTETVVTVVPGERISFFAHCDSMDFISTTPDIYDNPEVDDWLNPFINISGRDAEIKFDVPGDIFFGDYRFFMSVNLDNNHEFIRPLTIRVLGSRISVPLAPLSFSATSVGDTSYVNVAILNPGNRFLTVDEIRLPADMATVGAVFPLFVAPRDSVEVALAYTPSVGALVDSLITITCDDDLTPQVQRVIQAQGIPLTVSTEVLVEDQEAVIGVQVSVLVAPDEGVVIDGGKIHFRPMLTGGSFSSVGLFQLDRTYIGMIPGAGVTEGGVEYYVEVVNSGFSFMDPPEAPDGTLHFLAVGSPALVTSVPSPTSGSDYLIGRDVNITAFLEQGAAFASGSLHYRAGGADVFNSVAMVQQGNVLTSSIPGNDVGARGLEYWIEVNTAFETLTDPPSDPAISPRFLQTRIAGLEEPDNGPASIYRMVSLPFHYPDEFGGTLIDMLASQPEFGSYDPVRWRCFRYDPLISSYHELDSKEPHASLRLKPGRGFWLVCSTEAGIKVDPIPAYSTPSDSASSIELQPGWNQIGSPFLYPVAWSDVLVDGLTLEEGGMDLVSAPYSWNLDGQYELDVSLLLPWQGYMINNLSDPPRSVELSVLPVEVGADEKERGKDPLLDWELVVRMRQGGALAGTVTIGHARAGEEDWDFLDRLCPPPGPGGTITLGVPHMRWELRPGNYMRDVRSSSAWRDGDALDVWDLKLMKGEWDRSDLEEFDFTFTLKGAIPDEMALVLVDRRLDRVMPLPASSPYRFFGRGDTENKQRFTIIAGSAEQIDARVANEISQPRLTKLRGNYPNPFNPSTVIRYDLAQPGRFSLRIYDLRGTLIKILEQNTRGPGGYETVWIGDNAEGRRVAAGVYFYRLETEWGHRETRKMLLVK